jgi:hypothetical protein
MPRIRTVSLARPHWSVLFFRPGQHWTTTGVLTADAWHGMYGELSILRSAGLTGNPCRLRCEPAWWSPLQGEALTGCEGAQLVEPKSGATPIHTGCLPRDDRRPKTGVRTNELQVAQPQDEGNRVRKQQSL